jgi:predicted TIM-barrel fold metal-dependent hydrolase
VSDLEQQAKRPRRQKSTRIVWGTDWPHPNSVTPPGKKPIDVTPLLQIDDGRLLNLLPLWAPDAAIREKILVANPAWLYGFTRH